MPPPPPKPLTKSGPATCAQSWRSLPQLLDTPLDDAEDAALYTACHWPFHVWKRETRAARQLSAQVTARVFDGIMRLRTFRRWRSDARKHVQLRGASKKVGKTARYWCLRRTYDRVAYVVAYRKKVHRVCGSSRYMDLRARILARLPFFAWTVYARCRVLVRQRSCGELLLRREGMVHPFPVPPEWRANKTLGPRVERAIAKDVSDRKVTAPPDHPT